MAGLSISGKIYKLHFEGTIDPEKLLSALEHFRRHIKKPFILVWDQSRTHRSLLVKAYLEKHSEIYVEYLPSYAPELNPEEYCHGNVKRRIKNTIFHSKTEIRNRRNKDFARLLKRPDILLGFFHHAGLELNQLW